MKNSFSKMVHPVVRLTSNWAFLALYKTILHSIRFQKIKSYIFLKWSVRGKRNNSLILRSILNLTLLGKKCALLGNHSVYFLESQVQLLSNFSLILATFCSHTLKILISKNYLTPRDCKKQIFPIENLEIENFDIIANTFLTEWEGSE